MTIKDISSILHKLQIEVEKKVSESTNPASLKQALAQLKAAQNNIKRSEMVFTEEEEEEQVG